MRQNEAVFCKYMQLQRPPTGKTTIAITIPRALLEDETTRASLPWASGQLTSKEISIQLEAKLSPNQRQHMVQSDTELTASVRSRHAGNMLLYTASFPGLARRLCASSRCG